MTQQSYDRDIRIYEHNIVVCVAEDNWDVLCSLIRVRKYDGRRSSVSAEETAGGFPGVT